MKTITKMVCVLDAIICNVGFLEILKKISEVVLIAGSIIFLVHSLVGGLKIHQNIFFPALSWKWSLVFAMTACTTYIFWIADPILRKKAPR